ncbi:MAG: metallophosphoesterase [Massilibacteroides sp.]|nr:metallophosphoesterase [Massilibacteroides sp.]
MNKLFLVKQRWLFLALLILQGTGLRASIQLTHNPFVQNVTETEATIVWVVDQSSVGWLEYKVADAVTFYHQQQQQVFDTKNGLKNEAKVHTVRLTGLKPGTTYAYRVFSQEVLAHEGNRVRYGEYASTKVYGREPLRFTTVDRAKKNFGFAMINDIHGNSELLSNLMTQCNPKETDFVFFNGDMSSIFDKEEDIFEGFMNEAIALFASETPIYYVRGNHETRGSFAPYFQRYFSPRQSHIYQVYFRGDVCFIELDTGEDKPDSDIEYYGITDYDAYRTEQAAWLKRILQEPAVKQAKFRVVIGHIPPSLTGWHGDQEVAQKFVPLLNAADITVMLCGHLHHYYNRKADQHTHFPVIVNSNNTLLKGKVTANSLELNILDEKGKQVDQLIFH